MKLPAQAAQGRLCCSTGDGVGVTGREGDGGVGVGLGLGEEVGFSDHTGGLLGVSVAGSSEGSSEGEGLGDSCKLPKILVGPPRVGGLKSLYSRPS